MNVQQTASVLAKAAAFDGRTVGESDILAWHQAIGDLDAIDALDAVTAHYQRETRWLMPADVRTLAEAQAKRRAAAERRQLLAEAGWPDTTGTTAYAPAARDRKAELDTALRRLANQKAITT